MADDGKVLTMKRNDTDPPFRAQVRDALNPGGVDLTNAASAKLLVPGLGINASLTIEDQVTDTGWVNRDWQTTDLHTDGTYDVEVEITWVSGKKRTFPPHGYNLLVVDDDLG